MPTDDAETPPGSPEGGTPADFPDPGAARSALPIAGVGASAGGLDALRRLLSNLPADLDMAVVVVQHLDPSAESTLPEILAASSRLTVVRAADGMELEPGRVYVSPPNATLEVVWGRLRLTPRSMDRRPHMPIDHLMRSLSVVAGSRAIGVVLSGGGTDGTLGLKAIKDVDGITFAQEPDTASNQAMPRSAIASGCVDDVLGPEEIGRELARIGKSFYMNGGDPGVPTVGQAGDLGEAHLQRIFALMRKTAGVDFSRYKRSTILRRVRRRMALGRHERGEDYLRLLQEEPAELTALYQDFLIRVTSFFRDPEVFEALQKDVFPALIQERLPEAPIRLWVAGCSTGEEVYSLAIALMETLGEAAHAMPIKILATDVNERALDVARAGIYVENVALDISAERLRRYFVRVDGSYQITKTIRDLCVFSRHDLTRDPPFARLDLVSCRNLLIYLDLAAQRRVFPLFHYALRPGGHLMLGPSETIGTFSELFAPAAGEHKIFSRRSVATRPFMEIDLVHEATRGADRSAERADPSQTEPVAIDLQREADRLLLARYAPPGVLVDEDGRILQFRGQTDAFLAPAPGTASLELLKMAREGLMIELRSALAQARAENGPVRRQAVRVAPAGQSVPVTLNVLPLRQETRGGPRHFLVLFEEAQTPAAEPAARPPVESADAALDPEDARQLVAALRLELAAVREHLQSVIEEQEATTEELKSANEEILSSNEELQSTNEELQTAKEEMQSANEELTTVNEELNSRILELARTNDDLLNLFGSVNIPIVMVDRDLRIRRFTRPAEKLLNLIPADAGRPIAHIRPNLDIPDLDRRLADVLESLSPQDLEAPDRDGRWHSVRLRPYITIDNKIDGAVVAIVEVDELRRSTLQVRRALDYAEAIVEAVWQPLLVLDSDLQVTRANPAFYRAFRKAPGGAAGRPLAELGAAWAELELAATLRTVLAEGRPLKDLELTADFEVIGRRTFQLGAQAIDWKGAGTPMILVVLEDITDRKRELERDRALLRELSARIEAERANRKKDEFLAMLAHELRNPLSPVLNALLVLRGPRSSASDREWATQIMERQVRHMARLIDDLLDVSRVMRGTIELRRERVDLGRVVRHVVDGARPFVESRRHELTVSVAPRPIALFADPVRVEQVLTNLLQNAAKYTPEGGRIWLSVEVEGDEALVRVRDNGIGIAPEQLREVFELFMQVDRSLDRSLGGLGIGLTLVKTLVELHGGSVSAHSEGVGLGCEFVVRLPLADPHPGDGDDPGRGHREAGPARRILLVDDNIDALRTLELLLIRMGHAVRTAADGPGALSASAEFRPDLILLDLGLPGMDGFEVCRRLRSDPDPGHAATTIVALSGYGQEEDLRRARSSGFDEHAVKPVDLERLRQLLALRHGRTEPN